MDFTFNRQLAELYHGKTQIARVLTEDWVARNMYCPICGNSILYHYPANKPVADFRCESCHNDFELKSKEKDSSDLGKTINDGQYDKMIARITSNQNPNFFFMHYADFRVRDLILIPNHFFVPEIIIKRKPLSDSARRAGWIGCNINISGIPQSGKIFVIKEGEAIDKEVVIRQYHKTSFLQQNNLQKRGWIIDVLRCIEQIPSTNFSLTQVYSFIPELRIKHPGNNNIEAKIRQQLQFLRNQGYIEFTTRGNYRKI